jgi:hypothetical protein
MNLPFAIDRLRSVLRRQHKALSTESTYVHWLRHYVIALQTMPDSLPSEQKLERFLTDLAPPGFSSQQPKPGLQCNFGSWIIRLLPRRVLWKLYWNKK